MSDKELTISTQQLLEHCPLGLFVIDVVQQQVFFNAVASDLFEIDALDFNQLSVLFKDNLVLPALYLNEDLIHLVLKEALSHLSGIVFKSTTHLSLDARLIHEGKQTNKYALLYFQDVSQQHNQIGSWSTVTEQLVNLSRSYERFIPNAFLQLLKKESITDVEIGDKIEVEMTVLFSDIRSYTTLSESMTPKENFNFINSYLAHMEPVIHKHHGFIDKYIGDAIMALFDGDPDDAVGREFLGAEGGTSEMLKSITLSSSLSLTSMFSALMSRWITPCWWTASPHPY